ncbi:M28 family metallopeptidase [Peijinzhouia sedimentorum]
MKKIIYLIVALALLQSCNSTETIENAALFSEEEYANNLAKLASDEFLGRLPLTEGEEKTVGFLVEKFKEMGLEPGNGDSFIQDVPLALITGNPARTMTVKGVGGEITLEASVDYSAFTDRFEPFTELTDSEIVYAGFGIVAPEYGWNDYEGLDVKGKTVLVLVNDPGFGTEDESFFKGNTMTYYGRWTYKYEEAARQGAAGLLIIHNTAPAGYGWNVVNNNGIGPRLVIDTRDSDDYRPALKGWITNNAARNLFGLAGRKNYDIIGEARNPEFQGISLGLTVSMSIENEFKFDKSKNVIAKITGSTSPNEYILYSSHWDHLGVGAPVNGDSIYNGAADNATGTAALLSFAKAFKNSGTQPERTIIFLAVTAEEQGLLGSEWYAQNPIYPLEHTVANLNIDMMTPNGPTKDLIVIGYGQSELDDYVESTAGQQDRYVVPDRDPEKGYFFRSDHFSFAKVGVPAMFLGSGWDHVENGVDYGKSKADEFTTKNYHQPSDEFDREKWDLRGSMLDMELYYQIGNGLANSNEWPEWKEGSEFKALRKRQQK